MLFLLFDFGHDRYVLEAARIVEVLPLVEMKRIPHAPAGVAGVFDYRGTPVPVIDLSEIAVGRSALRRLSTRIVVVHYPNVDGPHVLGLIAEGATETIRRDPADFVASGVAIGAAPYLGSVTRDARGLIQWIEVERLLPQELRDLLFDAVAIR